MRLRKSRRGEVRSVWTLIIVDDNSDTLTGLSRVVDWQRLGIQLAGTASSGAEALELLEAGTIDIMLADIRMPNIDGIELTEIVGRTSPGTKVILISAYEEFEYARDAIRLGVEAYLVKPFSAEEIESTLTALCGKLNEERAKAEMASRMEQQSVTQRASRWNRRLEQLVLGEWRADESQASVGLAELGMPACSPPYYIMTIEADEPHRCDGVPDRLNSDDFAVLQGALLEQLSPGGLLTIFTRSADRALAFFALNRRPLRGPEDDPSPGPRVAERLRDVVAQRAGVSVTVAVGRAVERLVDLQCSLMDSERALDHRLYLGPGRTIYAAAVARAEAPPFHYPLEIEREILAAVSNGATKETARHVDEFTEALKPHARSRPREIRGACNALLTAIDKVLNGSAVDCEGNVGFQTIGDNSLSERVGFDELRGRLKTLACECAERVAAMHAVSLKARMIEAERFISDNIDRRLTLAEVAQRVGFSVNYFSTLFHQTKGCTFRDFVVALRIRRAKELLRTGGLRIYEIAQRVGYSDTRHFTQLFKRETGSTPHDFAAGFASQEQRR